MNSVMETGENIIFIHEGHKWWQGNREQLLRSDNKELNEFIFAGGLMREVEAFDDRRAEDGQPEKARSPRMNCGGFV